MALTSWSDSNFLSRLAAGWPGAEPFMVSAWCNLATGSAAYRFIYEIYDFADASSNRRSLRLADNDGLECEIVNGAQGVASDGTHPNNTWFNVCGAWVSSTSRSAWLNGGTSGDDATSVSVIAPNRTLIGTGGGIFSFPAAAGLAEISVWDLTGFSAGNRDSLAAALAAGQNPINLNAAAAQPWTGKLSRYWTLLNTSTLTDASGNDATPLTMDGTLTNHASHPTIDAVDAGGATNLMGQIIL
jgi:hypothetical protein